MFGGNLIISLITLVDLLRKEFKTLGVPDILEMALLSSSGKVLYTDLSRASMSRVSPFYNNVLMMGRGDNLTLTLDPVKSIVASKVSNKAVLITMTDKKVGIVLTKMGSLGEKYGEIIDEVIAHEESKTLPPAATPEAPKETPPPPERPIETPPPLETPTEAAPPPPPETPTEIPAPLPPAVPEPSVQTEEIPPSTPPRPEPEAVQEPAVQAPELPQPAPVSTPVSEIVNAAMRIVDDARIENRTLRVLGGAAIAIHCPSAKEAPFAREYPDIDIFAHAKDDVAIKKLLASLAYEPIKKFNALHGRKRLKFYSEQSGIGIDIYLDMFEMCHKLDFKNRLELDEYTISLADLLMTKLQMVKFTERDARDTIAIIKDHDLGAGNPEKIDVDYIAKLCSDDWGLYKTLTMNAEIITGMVADYHLSKEETQKIRSRFTSFLRRLEEEPKSSKWRKRAAVGEKSQWYENVD
jgi:hypothetical protein